MGVNYLLDTNLVIYAQKGALAQPLPLGRYFVSIVTVIEPLSFPGLTPPQERALAGLLAELSEVGIDAGSSARPFSSVAATACGCLTRLSPPPPWCWTPNY